MAKMGRPVKEIDWEEFDKLCGMQCTLREIAGWFQVSEDTIERRVKEEYKETFAEHYSKRSSTGKVALRRKQFDVAMKGHPTLLIWLGKQYLEQKDKMEQTNISDMKDDDLIREAQELLAKVTK